MAMREEPTIARAEEVLQYLGSFDEIRRYYEAREMAVHDEVTRLMGARQEGRQESRQEGIEMRNIQIVKNMRDLGMAALDIAKITGLTVEEIENIE